MTNCFRILVLFLLAALCVQAQVSASISGIVTDPSGAVVSGAAVTATDTDTGLARDAVTDSAGHYQLFALPLGQYEVQARKQGFTAQVRKGVRLVVGQTASIQVNGKDWNLKVTS